MAIIVPDQGDVDLQQKRGSKIVPADIYAPPVHKDVGRGAAEVAKALSAMGSTISSMGQESKDEELKSQMAQKDLYVEQVRQGVASGQKPTLDSINDITSPLHPQVRLAVTQSYGQLAGQEWARKNLEVVPEEARKTPEGQAAWIESIRQKAAAEGANGPLGYGGGFLSSVQAHINARAQQLSEARTGEWNTVTREGAKVAFANDLDAIAEGRRPQGVTGNPNNPYPTGSKAQSYTPRSEDAAYLKQKAEAAGFDPVKLATVMHYESGLNPDIWGGKGGKYYGLIQFGGPERNAHGVIPGKSTFKDQVDSAIDFLQKRGYKPGMSLQQMYATVNGGNPGASGNLSDGNGTISQHVLRMQAKNMPAAMRFLGALGVDAQAAPAQATPQQVAQGGQGYTQVADLSGQVPIPPQRPAELGGTPVVPVRPGEAPVAKPGPYDDITDPQVIAGRRRFFGKDEVAKVQTPQQAQVRDDAWDVSVNQALKRRDAKWLSVVPEQILTPEQRQAKITVSKQIDTMNRSDLLHDREAKKLEREEMVRNEKTRIDEAAASGKPMDPATYAGKDPDLFAYAQSARQYQRIDPYVSQQRSAVFQDQVFSAASTGNWGDLSHLPGIREKVQDGQKPTYYDVVTSVQKSDQFNPQEKVEIIKGLRKTYEGAVFISDPDFSKAFSARIQSESNIMRKGMDVSIATKYDDLKIDGVVRDYYDHQVSMKTKAAIASNKGLDGATKEAIIEQSIDKTRDFRDKLLQANKIEVQPMKMPGEAPTEQTQAKPSDTSSSTTSSSKPRPSSVPGYVEIDLGNGKTKLVKESEAQAARAEVQTTAKPKSAKEPTVVKHEHNVNVPGMPVINRDSLNAIGSFLKGVPQTPEDYVPQPDPIRSR